MQIVIYNDFMNVRGWELTETAFVDLRNGIDDITRLPEIPNTLMLIRDISPLYTMLTRSVAIMTFLINCIFCICYQARELRARF